MPADTQGHASPPSQAIAIQLVRACQLSRAVQVAAKLGVPDVLGSGARTFAEVAQVTRTEADRMRRLLRLLASIDVVRDLGEGRFELTAVGDCLRADVPHSVRAIALLNSEGFWPAFGSLADCIRTGKNAYQIQHGLDGAFSYMAQNPELAAIFDDAMSAYSTFTGPAVAQSYDFSNVRRVVDVGGGHGKVLATILKAHPHLFGTLLDMPSVVEGAPPLLAREDVADRCEVVGGDMFASVPAGGDVYLLSHIIHDWEDEPATRILRACRRAMAPEARLIIADRVLPERVEADPVAAGDLLLDLGMMVMLAGRERTESEFEALLATAGLRLQRVISLPIPDHIIEAVPA
jgi:orsellinic acid C2-O-methyltransferase